MASVGCLIRLRAGRPQGQGKIRFRNFVDPGPVHHRHHHILHGLGTMLDARKPETELLMIFQRPTLPLASSRYVTANRTIKAQWVALKSGTDVEFRHPPFLKGLNVRFAGTYLEDAERRF